MQIEAGVTIPRNPMKVKIDRDVPPPKKDAYKYPFSQLREGESFFVPATPDCPEPWGKISSSVHWANRRFKPKQFITRRVTENGLEGSRVWRIENQGTIEA